MAAIALFVLLFAVRWAFVQAFAERKPELAASAWPDHPRVIVQTALADIGRTTAAGRAPNPARLQRVRESLGAAPLSAEPFLVEGTQALSAGDSQRAEVLLSEAVARDPRLIAARFLLANLYLQEERPSEGLAHIAALIRRLPKAAGPLTPALAEFAKQPGAANEVRAILDQNSQLRGNVLATLSADPANAELVLGLAGKEVSSELAPEWQARLVSGLVKSGEYERAHRIWASFSGVPLSAREGLFNPEVRDSHAPAPFNWSLANGPAGIAEPAPGGGLHILFYGREDAVLAAQVMVLKPGRYQFRYVAQGQAGQAPGLHWLVKCLPADRIVMRQPLDAGRFAFVVPVTGCPAQELQLRGSIVDMPSTTEVTVRGLGISAADH